MARYEISFRRSVLRDLAKLPKKDVRRIISLIRSLAVEPRPPQSKKLSAQDRYRIRQGDYRVLYSIQDEEKSVWIVKVAHSKDVIAVP